MPEVGQITVSHREIVEMILRENGVTEGKWSLLLNMTLGTGMFGPSPQEANPGAVMTVAQIGVQRVEPGKPHSPGAIIVDAAALQTKPKSEARTARKKRR